MIRPAFAGLPALQAPSIGQEKAPLSKAATYTLNKARKLLGMPIGPSSAYQPNPWAGTATVPPVRPMPASLALPPAGATSNYGAARKTTMAQAYQQGGFRQAPPIPLPARPPGAGAPPPGAGAPPPPTPPSPPQPPAGGAGGGGGMAAFGRAMGSIQLPGAGLVREIGSEFAMAAKQVLLFGTAYKALAAITSLPQQVMSAVSSLQSFRNTLSAISPTAKEAGESNQFILDTVQKYNIPLESARDGFTKLYASMKPAGFSTKAINNLYLGISKASATLGLSTDKVDRVNYAFAQMASKGQLMAEEVSGQLGDVIPGALSIMAEAAQMDIKTFKKAMEDGVFVGKAFEAVMSNVPIVLEKRFGKGAEGAAKTFQGAINNMRSSLVLFYESFEPVAVGFLNSVVTPITSGLTTVTDGFNAFFTGTQAKTAGGFAFAQELEKLKPTFEGIRANVAALLPTLQSFGSVVLEVSKVFLQIAGNPFVGYLARVYLNVLALTTVINILNLRALIPFIANLARSAFALLAFSAQMIGANQGLQLLNLMTRTAAGSIRSFSIALQAAFSATAVGLAVVGLGMIAEAFMTAGARADAARQKMSQFADSVKQLGAMGDVAGATAEKVGQQSLAARLQSAKVLLQQVKTEGKKLTKDQVQELKNLQLTGNLDFVEVGRGTEKGLFAATGKIADLLGTQSALQAEINSAERGRLEAQTKIVQATRAITEAKKNQKKQETELQAIVPSANADKPVKEKSLESYYSLQDQLAKAQTQDDIDRIQGEFDYKTKLANSYYDLQEARANSFQKITIAFQKELFAIEQRRQQASISAQADVLKAQGSVAGGAGPTAGGAVPMTGGSATGAYLQGNIGPTSTGPHFDVKKMGRGYFPRDYLDQYVQVNGRPLSSGTTVRGGTFAGHQKRGSHGWDYAFGEGRHAATLKGGAKWMEGRPTEHGEARKFQLPTGEMFQFLHGKSEGIGAGAPRQVPGSEKRDLLADQQAAIALRNKGTSSLRAETIAAEESAIAIANYVAAIAPVAEQELQNQLLNKRIELMRTGVAGDYLETEIKIFEIREKQTFGIAAANQAIERNNKAVSDGRMKKEDANRLNAIQNKTIQDLITNIPKLITLTEQQAIAQKDLNFQTAKSDLNKQMKMAMALTPDAKLRVQLAEKYPGDTMKQEEEFAQTKMTEKAKKLEQDLQGIAASIGDSFGNAFKGIITGSMTAQQALAGFFQSIGDSFADMAAKMISEWLKVEAIKGIQSILGMLNPAGALGGAAAGAGSAPGLNIAGMMQYANAPSITPFATGGIVKGPTLGLVGEGRYNEAVVPLPDGKSIPVDLSGMGGGAGAISTNIVINVSNGQTQSNSSGGASDLGRKMEGAVKQVIASELRPGGLLAGGRR
jgi:tape measure domain-containing protein